jgi:hypothetical protein
MISSQENNVIWILDLKREKEDADFNRIVSSVDVISEEKHIGSIKKDKI